MQDALDDDYSGALPVTANLAKKKKGCPSFLFSVWLTATHIGSLVCSLPSFAFAAADAVLLRIGYSSLLQRIGENLFF